MQRDENTSIGGGVFAQHWTVEASLQNVPPSPLPRKGGRDPGFTMEGNSSPNQGVLQSYRKQCMVAPTPSPNSTFWSETWTLQILPTDLDPAKGWGSLPWRPNNACNTHGFVFPKSHLAAVSSSKMYKSYHLMANMCRKGLSCNRPVVAGRRSTSDCR